MGRGAQAIDKLQQAARLRRSGGIGGALQADALEREGQAMLVPTEPLVVSAGEVVPTPGEADGFLSTCIKNTLQNPDVLSAEASEARMTLAANAGVLELAADAAESIQAKNSLEKMLAHQMAAAHDCGMRLLARALDSKNPVVETARLVNAASRLLEIYQQVFQVLHRVRSGPQQIVVQHVQVTGQAVVAGRINRGCTRLGG